MDNQQFKYALFKLVAIKLKVRELSEYQEYDVIELYNSINPSVFRGQKLSSVLPVLSTVITRKLLAREGLEKKSLVGDVGTASTVKSKNTRSLIKGPSKKTAVRVKQKKTNIKAPQTKLTRVTKKQPVKVKKVVRQPRQAATTADVPELEDVDETVEMGMADYITDLLSSKNVKDRRRVILQLVKLEKEFDSKSGLNFDKDLEKLDELLAVKELGLEEKPKRKSATGAKFVERDISTKDMLKELIGSSAETENDRYMSANFYEPDQEREMTTFEKKKIKVNQFLGINDISTLQLLFNPSSLYVRYYVVLDTDYRIQGNDPPTGITKFKWNYASTKNLQEGFANSIGEIRDVISMRMYQPKIHNLLAMNTTAKRVSILIEEFSAQSFIGENGRRFHYTLRPNFSNSGFTPLIELTMEDNNDTVFNFRKPFTTIDTLTLSFGEPLNVLTFPLVFNRFFVAMEFTCFKSDR